MAASRECSSVGWTSKPWRHRRHASGFQPRDRSGRVREFAAFGSAGKKGARRLDQGDPLFFVRLWFHSHNRADPPTGYVGVLSKLGSAAYLGAGDSSLFLSINRASQRQSP